MTTASVWGSRTPGGGAARSLPVRVFPARPGGARSARDLLFASKRLPLFSNVQLVRPWHAEGESLPSGASGTVVEVLDEGRAYIVEFFDPHHCVVTVHDHALETRRA
jgi:hypothetical protein